MTLLLGTMCLPVIVAILGITVDLSVMYSIKTRLQMACDGAAVAALRSLNLGQTIASQTASATTVAQQWFTANFAGNFMGAQNTSAPTIVVTQSNTSFVTTVDVSAVTYSPSYFMKYYSFGATRIGATSEASRRNVVITLVLDRSGSMQPGGASAYAGSPCETMVNDAKQFTGAFQEGRDYVGLVTFGETVNVGSPPTQNFQTVLGYTNGNGTSAGLLDNVRCSGGTNTSSGLAVGWNLNYETALPGALNVIVLFTDGTPTASTFSFVTNAATDPYGTAHNVLSLASSTCTDSAGKAMKSGGDMLANPRDWTGVREATNGSAPYSVGFGAGSYWPSVSGPVGALYGDGTSFYGVDLWYQPGTINGIPANENAWKNSTEAPGCGFNNPSIPPGDNPTSTPDVAFIPPTDVWGNLITGYVSLPDGNVIVQGVSRTKLDLNNLTNVHYNTTDNMANFIRTTNPGTATFPGTLIYAIGLGSNGGVDSALLQRVANDPNPCPICSPALGAYAANTSQPTGKYVYSPNANDLSAAFATIASQIIRISR